MSPAIRVVFNRKNFGWDVVFFSPKIHDSQKSPRSTASVANRYLSSRTTGFLIPKTNQGLFWFLFRDIQKRLDIGNTASGRAWAVLFQRHKNALRAFKSLHALVSVQTLPNRKGYHSLLSRFLKPADFSKTNRLLPRTQKTNSLWPHTIPSCHSLTNLRTCCLHLHPKRVGPSRSQTSCFLRNNWLKQNIRKKGGYHSTGFFPSLCLFLQNAWCRLCFGRNRFLFLFRFRF